MLVYAFYASLDGVNSLGKCAAAALDILSSAYGDALLSSVLPVLTEYLKSDKWELHEVAILAIGAVAEGPS